ncbi:MAG TPA: chemotaxis response regulator protein-glutamate methylesterase [Anaerolineaceae bacterium]|nr:chemotaxis response regulator protein-glutamate methylesterase [Anaerolineaceae bacterium]
MNRPPLPVNSSEPQKPIRVLVVDDSAFMRFSIAKHLNQIPMIQVVGTARDGQEALEVIPNLQPDVITLDVEMPRMDGLSTLREIMADSPRPVIMLSSLTGEGTLETVQALTLGAVDFIAKPDNKANISAVLDEVAGKIVRAARAKVWKTSRKEVAPLAESKIGNKATRALTAGDRVLVIGSSTGGPRALNTVVPELPANLQAAVLIVQHMPVGFTRSLAERLDNLSALKVKEAQPGDRLEVGKALLAPGGFHMTVDASGQIALNQNQPVHGVRPAVDVTLTSVVQRYGKSTLAVILTGMGNDGTNGCALVHSCGGYVIAEAESTSVVWGMPRSVIEAGVADTVAPLPEVSAAIQRALRTN